MSLTKAELYISVVIPAYNEEENIPILYASLHSVLAAMALTYEIIFVDDGSSDTTFEALNTIVRNDTTVTVLKLRRNFGQTPAMAAGIDHARGEIIITLDADLQNDPKDIPLLIQKIEEGYDIVSGWRKGRKDKAISRKLPSLIANRMIALMTGVHIHDYGCTLKAYRASVVKKMHLYSDMHRFMAALGALSGAKVAELAVTHHARKFGVSKYGINRTLKVLIDVFTVKLILHFSSRPFHLFGGIGMVFGVVGLLVGLKAVSMYLLHPSDQLTPVVFPAIALMFFSLGVYLLALGMLSELVLKMSAFRPKDQHICA